MMQLAFEYLLCQVVGKQIYRAIYNIKQVYMVRILFTNKWITKNLLYNFLIKPVCLHIIPITPTMLSHNIN